MEYPDRETEATPSGTDRCHLEHTPPTPGKTCFSLAKKIAPAKCRSKTMDFICKSEMHPFTQFGALYQLVARRTGREHVNDYLYISENIYVQTEPHIHPRCRFPYFSSNVNPVNSTYHLSNLSTQHPQYQNEPLNSPLFSIVDQFPLTHKMKKSGNWNLSSDKPRLPEIPCFLHFFAILFFDF